MSDLAEYVGALPNLCGAEPQIEASLRASRNQPAFRPESRVDFGGIKSAFAIALHMHQPLIPAGGGNLTTAEVIRNLKHMMDNPGIGDNHNASVFHWCYKRMGEFIPQLVDEGKQPRVMLEYSGTLLHGLRQMGLNDKGVARFSISLPAELATPSAPGRRIRGHGQAAQRRCPEQ
jgi:hypothetical protein